MATNCAARYCRAGRNITCSRPSSGAAHDRDLAVHEGNLLSKQNETYDPRSTTIAAHVGSGVCTKSAEPDHLAVRYPGVPEEGGRRQGHLKLGDAFYRQKLFKESMAEVIRSIKLGAETRKRTLSSATACSRSGPRQGAQSVPQGIEISPEYPDLFNALGLTYLKMERAGTRSTPSTARWR